MNTFCDGCGQPAISATKAGRPICPDCISEGYGDEVQPDATPDLAAENQRLRAEVEALREALGSKAKVITADPSALSDRQSELLGRGVTSKYIWLSNNSAIRASENVTLGQLLRAGLVQSSTDDMPPGPPMPTPYEITEEGRTALTRKAPQ